VVIHSDKFTIRAVAGFDYNVEVSLICECGEVIDVNHAVDLAGKRGEYSHTPPDTLSKLIGAAESHWNTVHGPKEG
jgi:hypothetical protein